MCKLPAPSHASAAPFLFLFFFFPPQQTMRHTLSERSRRVSNERPGRAERPTSKNKKKKNRTTGTAATLLLPANERHNAAPRSSTDCGLKAGQTRALPRRANALGQNTNRRGVCGSLPKSRRKNRIRHDFFLFFFLERVSTNPEEGVIAMDVQDLPSVARLRKKQSILPVCQPVMLKHDA